MQGVNRATGDWSEYDMGYPAMILKVRCTGVCSSLECRMVNVLNGI